MALGRASPGCWARSGAAAIQGSNDGGPVDGLKSSLRSSNVPDTVGLELALQEEGRWLLKGPGARCGLCPKQERVTNSGSSFLSQRHLPEQLKAGAKRVPGVMGLGQEPHCSGSEFLTLWPRSCLQQLPNCGGNSGSHR